VSNYNDVGCKKSCFLGKYVHSRLFRPTQPVIAPGLLNRVPVSAGVKTGKSPLSGLGWQAKLCEPI
jgi:hypothetical protein